jgi:hypothetical protein
MGSTGPTSQLGKSLCLIVPLLLGACSGDVTSPETNCRLSCARSPVINRAARWAIRFLHR